ncbi:hypothetical protein BLA29_001636 [Euroglyphus maynei]|uniref:Protein kinase domain-containing protein n=1 Tax=Euroglyphus maynei TaxID=6958 RepID=A0A1Y3B0Z1_EURMA|nr:hypothetical protein BLA29_001636 [Euroglyphus maynei]
MGVTESTLKSLSQSSSPSTLSTSSTSSTSSTRSSSKSSDRRRRSIKHEQQKPSSRRPKLIHRDVTRFYEIPFGPYRRPEDVVRSFGYELLHELDRGGYGVVYIAHDLRKDMNVACKQIEMDRTFHRNAFEDNKNELLTIERVRHPYVIKVYCHFVVQGNGFNRMYIFMALADGGNLYKFLKNRNSLITEQQCRLYFAQILCGINHMHSVGIAHRDIKPQNVLLRSNRNSISGDYILVVTDFGLSKVVTDKQQLAKSICGTPVFMAPELLQSKPYNPFAADVWALGITLFQMLSMELPFNFQLPREMIIQSMMERKVLFESAFKKTRQPSNEYKQLIRSMLEPDEQQRSRIINITNHQWIVREFAMAESISRSFRSSSMRKHH